MASQPGSPADMPQLPGATVTDLQYNLARTYVGVLSVLSALSTLIVALRIVSRWKSNRRLDADDYLIVGAGFFGLVDMAVVIVTMYPLLGGSRPDSVPFSFILQVAPLSVVAEIMTTWSVALLKTSIAVMLLRFQHARSWTWFLYFVMGLQIVTAVYVTIMQSTRCVPMSDLWDPTIPDQQKRCWSVEAFKVSMTVTSVLVIITDVIYATIPLTFIRHIRRSALHRLIIGFLLSLGLFASAASIVKTVTIHRFDSTNDPSGDGMAIALWASIEAQVGIIAACIPCLRGPFIRLLSRLGIATEYSGEATNNDSAWPDQNQAIGNNTPRSVRIPGDMERGDFGGSRPATRRTVKDSDDDSISVPFGDGRRTDRDRIEGKTDFNIELASLKATSKTLE